MASMEVRHSVLGWRVIWFLLSVGCGCEQISLGVSSQSEKLANKQPRQADERGDDGDGEMSVVMMVMSVVVKR
jgi:hypothetical protein